MPVSISGLAKYAVCAMLTLGLARIGPAQALPPEEVKPHLEPYADYLAEQMARHAASLSEEEKYREFIVHLDPSGPTVNPAEIRGGYALYEAAVYCAVLTGDFEVTLGDILAAGFWPYATLPDGLDLGLAVADAPEFHTFDETLLEDVGSPDWLAWHKAQLLLSFYRDFFFRPPTRLKRTAADLGQPLTAFWINPYTGAPMQVGEMKGELSLNDVETLRFELNGVVPSPQAAGEPVLLPFINTIDRPALEFELPTGFMRPRPD